MGLLMLHFMTAMANCVLTNGAERNEHSWNLGSGIRWVDHGCGVSIMNCVGCRGRSEYEYEHKSQLKGDLFMCQNW